MNNYPFVSVIIPVKNEELSLPKCLKSLKNLEYPQDKLEIIIVDGFSTDSTVQIAKSYGAKVISNPTQTVSPGRNIGFQYASGELIAFSDADCTMDKDWLKNSIKYFQEENIAGVGGPNFPPNDISAFGQAVNFLFNLGSYVSDSAQALESKKIEVVESLPGCNAIYKKNCLDKIMPIDETLLTCDDTEMNYRLQEKNFKLLYTPDTIVWHYRRDNPKKFWKQIYRYAIGRLQLIKKRPQKLNPIHILFGLGIPVFLSLALLGIFFSIKIILLLFFVSLLTATILFTAGWLKYSSMTTATNILLAATIFVVAWSAGFLKELAWPIKNVKGK